MIKVTENLWKIQDLLRAAAVAAGRAPESVRLLAVSKRKPVESILEAAAGGQRDFGENFAQEGVDKIDATGRDDLIWHFIGHLQSNKTRLVAERYDWVHTIDRIKIARRLSEQRPHHAGDLNVCIQVNVDDEQGKSGIRPEEVDAMASEITALPKLKLRGLMCIPAVRSGMDAQRKPFAVLRKLLESLQQQGFQVDTLSMGMSADYPAAIREGATIVRIGTLLFGERDS